MIKPTRPVIDLLQASLEKYAKEFEKMYDEMNAMALATSDPEYALMVQHQRLGVQELVKQAQHWLCSFDLADMES